MSKRKIIVSIHTSLDGFVAGPNGEMDWINLDDEMFDLGKKVADSADTALYGRVTFEMMHAYWPTAADHPGASQHDIDHSHWYKKATKVVLSTTMQDHTDDKIKIIRNSIPKHINKLKKEDGKNILIFGSSNVIQSLFNFGLIDEFWLFVNPVILRKGKLLFDNIEDMKKLSLIESKSFPSGVAGLHYANVYFGK